MSTRTPHDAQKTCRSPAGSYFRAGQDWAYTITPSAMPTGSRFMISVGPGPHTGTPTNNRWSNGAPGPAGVHVSCGPSVPPAGGYPAAASANLSCDGIGVTVAQ